MPRTPRKSLPVQNNIETQEKLHVLSKIYAWFKLKLNIILFGLLISLLSVASTLIVQKLLMMKTTEALVSTNVDTSIAGNKIIVLEQELEKQILITKKLESSNDTLLNNLKTAEKRIQFHNEILKRMCEYIVVITVDKKIIPRQCLSDYNWKKEEGL
jgi:hypothetical protein